MGGYTTLANRATGITAVIDANGNLMIAGTVAVSGIANPVAVSSITNPVTTHRDPIAADIGESSIAVDDDHSYTIAAADSDRMQVIITNLGTNPGDVVFLSMGGTATPTHMQLGPGERFSFPGGFVHQGDINAIAATGVSVTLAVTQFLRP